MSDRTKHDSVRKHLTMLGIATVCACVLLGCCSLLSLRELKRLPDHATPTTATTPTTPPSTAFAQQLQYAALLSLAALAASVACAAALIRRELQATVPQAALHEAPNDVCEGNAAQAHVELLQAIVDALPMRVAYVDREQRFAFINRSGFERHGRTRAELVGRPAAEFVTALRTEKGAALLQAAYSGKAQRFEHDDELNGRPLRLETHIEPDFDSNDGVRGLFVIGVDITALKEAERELRDLTDVIESTPDYVAQTDSGGQLRYLNPAARAAVGIARTDSLAGRNFSEFYTPETMERLSKEIIPAASKTGVWVGETTVVLQGGRVSPINHMVIAHRDAQGRVARYSSLMRNISAEVRSRRAEKDHLVMLSERDPLTSLLNRAGFEKYLVQKVQQGEGSACCLLYIDLDHFKPINDTHGHAAGDEVLREFAARLSRAVRPSDAVARLGGDEFAVVLAGLREPEDGARVAQKLVDVARVPFLVGRAEVLLSASIGVAFNAESEGGWKGLVQRADALLYKAKAAGRARLASEHSYAA
jgi:diguanylate cyclase (GGDEF)-like protein/PAS domain S-box-containing protein